MSDSNSISVIIPVFNCERYLGEAIESVLAQTRPPDEIIVVDDGSTDRSGEIAKSFAPRVHCKHKANGGIASARNHGIEFARGDWLAFLDADDLWQPEKLALQFAEVKKNPSREMIFCGTEQFFSPELDEATRAKLAMPVEKSVAPLCGAMLVRREIFQRVGLFDAGLPVAEFIDWFARACDAGVTMATFPDALLRRRWHLSNTSRRQRESYAQLPRILKQSLDRRRLAGAKNL